MTDDLNSRIAVEIMGWELIHDCAICIIDRRFPNEDPRCGRNLNYTHRETPRWKGGNWKKDVPYGNGVDRQLITWSPTTRPEQCDLSIRKMQTDGWEYRRGVDHVFVKGDIEVGCPRMGMDDGFDCGGVVRAMLNAKEAEHGG